APGLAQLELEVADQACIVDVLDVHVTDTDAAVDPVVELRPDTRVDEEAVAAVVAEIAEIEVIGSAADVEVAVVDVRVAQPADEIRTVRDLDARADARHRLRHVLVRGNREDAVARVL